MSMIVSRRRTTLLALSVFGIAAIGSPAIVQAAANPAFKTVLTALKKTHVPVLLPSYLPVARPHTEIIAVSRNVYEIDVAYVPNCHEATACHIGYVRGELPARYTSRLTGQKIALSHNLTGYFVKYGCGASCGDSTLAWNEKGYRYTFGLHAGALGPLKIMVNSAINNGPST
jgi:hypothetical protein